MSHVMIEPGDIFENTRVSLKEGTSYKVGAGILSQQSTLQRLVTTLKDEYRLQVN